MDHTAGSRLLHYTLEKQIGVGGMGTVWAARDARTGARVALKLLRGSDTLDTARVRLLREAHATRRVAHPAIVPVIDVLSFEENPLLVMELLHGETLRAMLQREQSLALPVAARLLLPIAEALGEAHSAGIVHRDLKPENIFIEAREGGSGPVRLLDFGVAQSYASRGGLDQTPITELGTLLGTLAYMAPEQALHPAESNQRVDVWAFGVVLYEALSGCRPIEGRTAPETMRQLLVGGITPLRVLSPELPVEITELVEGMLTRRPEDRLGGFETVTNILRSHSH